ncbi:MAG: hypothetical protein KDB80_05445 [Planctomycetes bacterium]|nr:hypothetical protein [Planctomycetota bacterium]
MSGYAPSSPTVLVGIVVAAVFALALGYVLQAARPTRAMRLAGWVFALVAVGGCHFALVGEAAGLRMVALVVLLLHAMKAVTAQHVRANGMRRMTLREWLAFAVMWTGMEPRDFTGRASERTPWLASACGFAFLGACAYGIASVAWRAGHARTAGLLLVCAGILVLHFGIVPCVAAWLRHRGFATQAQFRAPWRSSSLREFWARRWNVGYSVMMAHAIQRPIAARFGRGPAVVAVFVASGLFHEVAISLPVGDGFGLPTSYFALHGLAMVLERGRTPGRLWAFCWVVLPAPLLFHLPFLQGVVLPTIEWAS